MSVFYFLVKMCYQDNSGCNNMWIWISFWNKSLIFPGIKKFRLICSKLATNLCKGWQLLTTCQMKYNNCSFIIFCWWTGRYSTWFKLSSICFFFGGGGFLLNSYLQAEKYFWGEFNVIIMQVCGTYKQIPLKCFWKFGVQKTN